MSCRLDLLIEFDGLFSSIAIALTGAPPVCFFVSPHTMNCHGGPRLSAVDDVVSAKLFVIVSV